MAAPHQPPADAPAVRAWGGRRYRLLARRGGRGPGTWLGERVFDDAPPAPVVLTPIARGDAAGLDAAGALRAAAALVKRLRGGSHPGVVAPVDVVALAGRPAVVTPFVEGADLRQLLETRPPLSALLDASRRLARALAACHGLLDPETEDLAPVCHGRLTLEAVRLTPEGRLRLVGFGRSLGPGRPADDVAALGRLIYRMLAGAPLGALPDNPWDHSAEVLNRVLVVEGTPEALLDLVVECLAWAPEQRPSAGAVARGLDAISAQVSGPTLREWPLAGLEIPSEPPPRAAPAPPPELEEDVEDAPTVPIHLDPALLGGQKTRQLRALVPEAAQGQPEGAAAPTPEAHAPEAPAPEALAPEAPASPAPEAPEVPAVKPAGVSLEPARPPVALVIDPTRAPDALGVAVALVTPSPEVAALERPAPLRPAPAAARSPEPSERPGRLRMPRPGIKGKTPISAVLHLTSPQRTRPGAVTSAVLEAQRARSRTLRRAGIALGTLIGLAVGWPVFFGDDLLEEVEQVQAARPVPAVTAMGPAPMADGSPAAGAPETRALEAGALETEAALERELLAEGLALEEAARLTAEDAEDTGDPAEGAAGDEPEEDVGVEVAAALAGALAELERPKPLNRVLVRVPDARTVILNCGGRPTLGLSTAMIPEPELQLCAVDASFIDGDAVGVFELGTGIQMICERTDGDQLDCREQRPEDS